MLGWTGLLAVILLVLAGVLGWSAHQQDMQADVLEKQLVSMQRTQATSVKSPRVTDTVDGLDAFYHFLLPHEAIPQTLKDLITLAEAERVFLQVGEYTPQVDSVGGFMRYKITLPLKGNGAAIQKFLITALKHHKSLALASAAFKRERAGTGEVEARIQLVLLTHLDPSASLQGREDLR